MKYDPQYLHKAIKLLTGASGFSCDSNGEILGIDSILIPSKIEIDTKIQELEAAEPLRLLRIERDRLLTASDWRMTKDYPYADQLDWEDYRFELRELPQRIENGEVPAPTLDENGMLVFDEWPLKPEETA